jgi:hypothetical protein
MEDNGISGWGFFFALNFPFYKRQNKLYRTERDMVPLFKSRYVNMAPGDEAQGNGGPTDAETANANRNGYREKEK